MTAKYTTEKTWTTEDAAVAADVAMDCGVYASELWKYLPLNVIQMLTNYPEQFASIFYAQNIRNGTREWVNEYKDSSWSWAATGSS